MEKLIDGMSFKQAKYNVYAFGAQAKRLQSKVDGARKPHTRGKWQNKLNDALMYLENNKQRLAQF